MNRHTFTATGIMADGKPVLNAHVRIAGRRYTRDGWQLDLIGRINETDLPFTVPEASLHKPAEWISALGPDVRFDKTRSDVVVEAIKDMSRADFRLEPKSGFYNEADGLYCDGVRLADFRIDSVKRETTYKDGERVEHIIVDVNHKGTSKRLVLTQPDLTRHGAIARMIANGAEVSDQIRLAIYLRRTADGE